MDQYEKDCGWKKILSQSEIQFEIGGLAKSIDQKYKDKDLILCSILKGAVYFTVDLSRALQTNHSLYFIEASSYIGQTQSDQVEMLSIIQPDKFQNKHILLY